MGVDEGSQIALCVFSGARQLFGKVGFASGLAFFASKADGVRSDVGDVDAVRSSVAPLVDAAACARGVEEMFGNVS
jgi:hypothetical protein